jgi:hypothetical protein
VADLDELGAEQERIARQHDIAKALLSRGASGGLINLYSGNQMMEKADQDRAALAKRYQEGLAAEVARIAQMRQGRPEIPAPADELGGGPGAPAQAGDTRGSIQAALLSRYSPVRDYGKLEHATYEREESKKGDREARLHERILALDAAAARQDSSAAERTARATEAAELRRELAAQADTTRRDLAERAAKPPAGYRHKPDGTMEAIPGGPADTKLTGQYNADTAALQSNLSALDRLAAQVKLTQDSSLGRTTGLMGMLPNVPGQPGAVAQSRLDSLKSQVGFGVLQELRNTAKNGASGLGQVTEKEHAMLQMQLGNLEKAQGEEEIRRVLGDIAKFTEKSKERIRAAYNLKHGDKATAGGPKIGDVQDGYRFKGGDPAKPESWVKQ